MQRLLNILKGKGVDGFRMGHGIERAKKSLDSLLVLLNFFEFQDASLIQFVVKFKLKYLKLNDLSL